jgi:hypothetical protein
MAVLAQALVQVLRELDLVFDDQKSHGRNFAASAGFAR